jgi:glycosyltransferase involved in cell wall biosynthesis
VKPEPVAFCTVVAKNYLAHARVLVASLRRHHPQSRVYVLLVDETDGFFEPAREAFTAVSLSDLDLPHAREFCFRYDVVELSTAVRPFLLRHLLARHERVVYLDPDIRVYQPLDAVVHDLDRWPVLLTPHLSAPLDPGQHPGERHILMRGAYNMGFFGLRRGAEADHLLRWLGDRLERECLVDPSNGLFVDQRWMDLAPGMVDGVRVLRHPGCNVGHWNIRQRRLGGTAERPEADGRPLLFFHFSGFQPERPSILSHFDIEPVSEEPLRSLLAEYGTALKAAGYDLCSRWPYTHATFSDGYPVAPDVRGLFREQPPGRFPDPFLVDGEGTFLRWVTTQSDRATRARPAAVAQVEEDTVRAEELAPIVRRILAVRDDVRRAYETADGRIDRPGLLGWLANDGVRHYRLKPEWCADWGARPATPEVMPRLLALYDGRPDLQRRFPMAFVEEHDAPAFLAWIEAHPGEAGFEPRELELVRALFAARPTARIRETYAKRPDVMKAYPAALDSPADPGFMGWLLHSGWREQGVPADWARWFERAQSQHLCLRVHLAYAARKDWQQTHPRGLSPLGRQGLLAWLVQARAPELGAEPGALARLCPPQMLSPIEELRRLHSRERELQDRFPAAFRQVRHTEGLLAWLEERSADPGGVEPEWVAAVRREMAPLGLLGHGVTVVGYLKAGFGLGELARATVRALEAVEYPYATASVDHAAAWQADFADRPAPAPFPFSIVHLNPDGVRAVRERLDLGHLPGRYRIGYWAWELEEMPADWSDAFSLFDEVWTCSRHAAAALATAAPVPVQTLWPAIEEPRAPEAEPPITVDPDEFTFLFIYDLFSHTARKNPLGLIEAFRRAFRADDRVRLVIKTANGSFCRDDLGRVENAAKGLRVTVRDRYCSRAEILALLGACDAYVSLHRAEGFGFTLAEAMSLGKPVIATHYSGNVDFTTPWNSFPVPYSLVENPARHGPYSPGQLWAEPDLDAAAHLMRQVYERPDRAAAVARRGQADVRRLLSPKACGERIEERFRTIRRYGLVEPR